MAMAEQSIGSGTTTCPYCKEEIKAGAIKCKHCGSAIAAAQPAHGGTCPYCKEEIHKDAVRCKHCHAALGEASAESGCGCGGGCGGGKEMPTGAMARVGRPGGVGGMGGLGVRWPLQCRSYCSGSTLWCECFVPGTNWVSIYPCGSCIDDPYYA